jgi:pimeloyl-ACP methyl ester carboxylesterase
VAVSSPPRPAPLGPYGPRGRSPWMDVDWGAHQRWVTVGGSRINVIELGEGPPLLFVHGLAGSWPNWLEQLPVFAGRNGDSGHRPVSPGFGRNGDSGRRPASPGFGRHRVIAVDLPGFGHSPLPSGPISIAGYADTLDALLQELGMDAVAVVGNSMGGFISAELAIRHPHRVERLVLVSPAGVSTYNNPGVVRYLQLLARVGRQVAAVTGWVASNSEALVRRPGLRNVFFGAVVRHPSRLPGPLVAEQLRGSGKPGFIPALQAISDYDLRPHLERIACPTLVVWGDHDQIVSRRDLEVFGELIPGARQVLYEDTGHVVQLERPTEFNALLAEFLNE